MKQRLLAATSLIAAASLSIALGHGASAKTEYIMRMTPTPGGMAPSKPVEDTTKPPVKPGPVLSYVGIEASIGYPMTATPVIAATGATRFSIINGKLPAALAFDPDTGLISGVATSVATIPLTIQAENVETKSKSVVSVTLRVSPVGTVAEALPRLDQGGADVTGAAYDVLSTTMTGSGAPILATFDRHRTASGIEIAGPGATGGWILEAETASGWITAATGNGPGSFPIPNGVTAQAFRLTANGPLSGARLLYGGSAPYAPSIQPVARLSPVLGEPVDVPLSASNTEGSQNWSLATGALPPGVSVAAGGALTGAARQVGLYKAGVVVADARATSAPADVELSVQASETAGAMLPSSASTGGVAALYDAAADTYASLTEATPLSLTYATPVRANMITLAGEIGASRLELDALDPAAGQWRTVASSSGSLQGALSFPDASAEQWRLRVSGGSATLRTFRIGYGGSAPVAPGVTPSQSFSVTMDTQAQGVRIAGVNVEAGASYAAAPELLPPGMSLQADGSLVGSPTQAGVYTFPVRVSDARGVTSEPRDVTVRVLSPYLASDELPLTIAGSAVTRSALYDASQGTTYAFANGGATDIVFARDVTANGVYVDGNLSGSGVRVQYLDRTGAYVNLASLSGNGWNSFPDTAARTFRLVNERGFNVTAATLKIGMHSQAPAAPAVSATPLVASMTEGQAGTPITLSGTDLGYSYGYAVSSGSLPPGVSPPDVYGRIMGTPTAPGSYDFSVTVRNNQTGVVSAPLALRITVIAKPSSLVPKADSVKIIAPLDGMNVPSNDQVGYVSALYDKSQSTGFTFYDNYYADLLQIEWLTAPAEMDCAVIDGNSGTGYVYLYAGSFSTSFQVADNQTINFGYKVSTKTIKIQKWADSGRWGRYTYIYDLRGGNMVNGVCQTP